MTSRLFSDNKDCYANSDKMLVVASVMILGRLPGCAFYESLTCLFTYENDACLLLGNSTVLAAIFFGTIYPIVFRV